MTLFSRRAAGGLAAVAGLVLAMSAPSLAQSQGIIKKVRSRFRAVGSIVTCGWLQDIVVRHGATFSNQADTDPFNFDDVAKQQTSTTRARSLQKHLATQSARLACLLGKSTRASSIELTTARPSRLRGHRRTQFDLTEGRPRVTPDENNRRAEAFRKLLAQAPENGKNNFLITHKPNIVDALGKDSFDVKEVRGLNLHA